MTQPPPGRTPSAPTVRPDRYKCPACPRWCGEHMNTRLLSRHHAPGTSRYDLCQGSLRPLQGLTARAGHLAVPNPHTPAYTQPGLFPRP